MQILPAGLAWLLAAGTGLAQAPEQRSNVAPLELVKARVPVGDVIYVTDDRGATTKGRLAGVGDDELRVEVKAAVRGVPAAGIRRVQWQQTDSPLTGALIGAGIGAVPGIYWLVADPNECTGMCPEEYALIAVGAVVGGLIDRAIKKKVTVYSAEMPGARGTSVRLGPMLMRDRKGIQIVATF